MTMRSATKLLLVGAPAAWLAASHPAAARVAAFTAGVGLVTWAAAWLVVRRNARRLAAPAAPSRRQTSTVRPEHRIDRRPTRRGPRDVQCPASRSVAQRHRARRPIDR